ncbi:MAG: hypothetical protein ISS71_09900 [Phycisphaerae bacterium]|nr:hypothetical protein [Phycisphaerae bacterium]
MGIQNWSDDVILVNLAKEPDMGEELQTVIGMVTENDSLDVVVDFADVDILTSSCIAKLLKLRKVLCDNTQKLIFCSIQPKTRSVFSVTGLDSVFHFVDDQFVALASLQLVN